MQIYNRGNIFIVVLIIVLLGIGAIMSFFIFLHKSSNTAAISTTSISGLAPTVAGDFLRDGKVTQEDIYLVRNYVGCKKTDACWNKVVGKTHDGDNPIYTSDLDVNGDGIIDDKDIPILSK